MIITFRLSDEQAWLFRQYAQEKGVTVSALIRQCVKERIKKDCETNKAIMKILDAKYG